MIGNVGEHHPPNSNYTAEAPPVDGKPFLPICTTPVVLANYADTVADEKLDLEQGAAS